MNKKKFLILGVLILTCLGIIGFIFDKQLAPLVSPAKLYPGKITIAVTQWPGYSALYVAQDQGYFKDAGLDVDVKIYPSLLAQRDAYVSGEAQGSGNITLDTVDEAYAGLDHKAVLEMDYSNGADGIIASPAIHGFPNIKGKRVAFEEGTLEEFFLQYALEANHIDIKDIVPVNLNAEQSAQALVDGKVDVAVTYEPFMAVALAKSGGKKIFSSIESPGLIADVLTFRADFIKTYPDSVLAFIGAYFKGTQFLNEHPQEADAIVAKYLGVSVDEVIPQIQGVSILSAEDNRTAFTFALGSQSIYGNLRSINEFLQAHQSDIATTTAITSLDTDNLIDPSFIRTITR